MEKNLIKPQGDATARYGSDIAEPDGSSQNRLNFNG